MFTRGFGVFRDFIMRGRCPAPKPGALPVATKALPSRAWHARQSPSCCHSTLLASSAPGGARTVSPTALHPDTFLPCGIIAYFSQDVKRKRRNPSKKHFRRGGWRNEANNTCSAIPFYREFLTSVVFSNTILRSFLRSADQSQRRSRVASSQSSEI